MITQSGVDSMWKTHVGARYAKLPRARPYALSNDAKRFIVWLWMACEKVAPDNPADLFKSSLEQFADAGINVLQPATPNELKAPEAWRDPWGNVLPNPFATGDLQGQSLLSKRDSMLAQWLKKFADSPYAAACEWQDAQAAIEKKKALSYDSDSHQLNVFVNGANETEKAQFFRNAPPEVVERCKWEARPIEFPTAGKNFDLTKQSKILSVPRLSALWDAMVEEEREFVAAEKVALRQQRSEAESRLRALEAADAAPQPPRLAQRARLGAE
jgi:hypothetical protein